MSNVGRFIRLLEREGSHATYHREDGGTDCPCRTPEGFRDPQWHIDHPLATICNENGKLSVTVIDLPLRAFVQPVQSSRSTRMNSEYATQMFGQVQADDHLGIFPMSWQGVELDFVDWGQAGEDFVSYDERRFLVVGANKIPDPSGGKAHHWEVGLRLLKNERVTD